MTPAAIAVPGDITTVTGGYIYDRRLLEELQLAGREMSLVPLPDSFPFPSVADAREAISRLTAIADRCPVIIDGLAFGALETAAVARLRAPIIALVHHPLALETALTAAQQAHFFETERDNLRHAAQVLVPSPNTAKILIERYDVPADRLHIAIPGSVQRQRSEKRAPQSYSVPLILSVGILHPRKGHDALIDALSQVADLDWSACIVGTPWAEGYSQALRQQISQLGLEGRIHLAERLPEPALVQLYEQASVFALATRHEGYGIVFNEALVHGLPIVSCHTGAVPDTVPAAARLLVPCDDSAAFSGALRMTLTDPIRYAAMAQAAAHFGSQLPDWAETARIAGHAIDAAARATQ